MIKFPEKIKSGDTIGVTAISEGANPDSIDDAINNLNRLGFSTYETNNVRSNSVLVSSDGETRAKEFMELWKNKDIKCIIAARGGEVSLEMLPYLEQYKKEILKYQPKWVQGFSDTTVLLHYLTTNYNIATVHANNIGDFAMKRFDLALENTINILKDTSDENIQESFIMYQDGYVEQEIFNSYVLNKEVEYINLYGRAEEKITGRIIGGCIDVLSIFLGTKYDNTVKFCEQFKEGMLWYFDNCQLNILDLYRTLWQFKEAGWFKNANGFIIGRTMVEKIVHTDRGDITYADMLKRFFDTLNLPVIYDVDIGHLPPQFTMINGAYGEFYYMNKKGKLIQTLK